MQNNRILYFLCCEVQLFILIFPFITLFSTLNVKPAYVIIEVLSYLLLFLSVLYILYRRQRFNYKEHYPLLIFLFFILLSILWVEPFLLSDSLYLTSRTIITILQTYVVIEILAAKHTNLLSLLKKYAVIIAIASLIFIILFPGLSLSDLEGRYQSFFPAPNSLGQIIAFAFIIINLYDRKKNSFLFLLFINSILIYQAILSDSMTSITGAVICFLVYKFRFLFKPLFIAVIIIGLLTPLLSFLYMNYTENLEIGSRDLTFTGRNEIWEILIVDMLKTNKLGLGFGYAGYWGIEDYSIFSSINHLFYKPHQGHNGFIDIWVHLGFVGLGLYLLFLSDFIKKLFKKTSSINIVFSLIILLIFINNITETSLFRIKDIYFIIFMLMYWYVKSTKKVPAIQPRKSHSQRNNINESIK